MLLLIIVFIFLASPSTQRFICDNQIQSKCIHKLSSRIHLTNSILQGGLENREIKGINSKELSKPRTNIAVPSVDLGKGWGKNPAWVQGGDEYCGTYCCPKPRSWQDQNGMNHWVLSSNVGRLDPCPPISTFLSRISVLQARVTLRILLSADVILNFLQFL